MPIEPTPIINVTTPVPISTDPTTFEARADLAWTELPVAIDGVNQAAQDTYDNAVEVFETASDIAAAALVAADAAGLYGRMNGSLALGAGTKAILLTAAKPELAVANKQVFLILDSDPTIRMAGNIASSPAPTSTAFSVTVASGGVFPYGGSGSYSGWKVIDAGFYQSAATAPEVWAGNALAALSAESLVLASEFQTLTDAATIAWNTATQGFNAKLTLTSSGHTVGAPTNLLDGLTYVLDINPASYTCSWNSIWDFGAVGAPSLPANVWSKVTAQYRADRNKLEAGVWRGA